MKQIFALLLSAFAIFAAITGLGIHSSWKTSNNDPVFITVCAIFIGCIFAVIVVVVWFFSQERINKS